MKLFRRGVQSVRLTKKLNRNILTIQKIVDRIRALNIKLDMAISEQEDIKREADEEIKELSVTKNQNLKMLKNFEGLIGQGESNE